MEMLNGVVSGSIFKTGGIFIVEIDLWFTATLATRLPGNGKTYAPDGTTLSTTTVLLSSLACVHISLSMSNGPTLLLPVPTVSLAMLTLYRPPPAIGYSRMVLGCNRLFLCLTIPLSLFALIEQRVHSLCSHVFLCVPNR